MKRKSKELDAMRRWLMVYLSLNLWAAGCGGAGSSTSPYDGDTDVVEDVVEWSGEHVSNDELVGATDADLSDFAADALGTAELDAEPEVVPGGFLSACASNEDCNSGFCVEGPAGLFCTRKCMVAEDCPDGYSCVGMQMPPDVVFLCMSVFSRICEPCQTDAQCGGGVCVDFGEERACSAPCTEPQDCPEGYQCTNTAGDEGLYCYPMSGSCECSQNTVEQVRGCSVVYADPGGQTITCYGLQTCEADGWGECVLPEEKCDGKDNDCDGEVDEGWLDPETGKYVSDENCGVCGNNCKAMQVEHGEGVCDSSKAVPDCAITCDDGFFDVDGNPGNGCECQYFGPDDDPDGETPEGCLSGECLDTNCDGVDGVVDDAIFVAKWGKSDNDGSITAPLATVQAGIDKALELGKRGVYVATGVYAEPLTLQKGVRLYGGYSADFTNRDVLAYETVILGTAPGTSGPGVVNAIGINGGPQGSTVLSGFVVIGYDSEEPGMSSYTVYVRDCDATLRIHRCRLIGGKGSDGSPGEPGSAGASGVPGSPGKNAYDIGSPTCGPQHTNKGGQGGKFACGDVATNGGDGGDAVCPDFDESSGPLCPSGNPIQTSLAVEHGKQGANNPEGAGLGGVAGQDSYVSAYYGPYTTLPCVVPGDSNCSVCTVPQASRAGADGKDGVDGKDGLGGEGCSQEQFDVSNGLFVSPPGSNGQAGAPGGGGGGGGAAGGVETYGCSTMPSGQTDIGGSGGGGGSGGCGGTGGTGGGSGGGSFVIFMTFSEPPATIPDIEECVITPSRGGDGGNGGPGGVGGSGGTGASGGSNAAHAESTFCTSGGGHGGSGGRGGHGGGGGGGCGGPSYGIFVVGADPSVLQVYKTANEFLDTGEGGKGGIGGSSLGHSGGNGAQGTAAPTNF